MLVDTQSPFQHIQIFDSETYGRVLVLDGAIQVRFRTCLLFECVFACACFRLVVMVVVIGGCWDACM